MDFKIHVISASFDQKLLAKSHFFGQNGQNSGLFPPGGHKTHQGASFSLMAFGKISNFGKSCIFHAFFRNWTKNGFSCRKWTPLLLLNSRREVRHACQKGQNLAEKWPERGKMAIFGQFHASFPSNLLYLRLFIHQIHKSMQKKKLRTDLFWPDFALDWVWIGKRGFLLQDGYFGIRNENFPKFQIKKLFFVSQMRTFPNWNKKGSFLSALHTRNENFPKLKMKNSSFFVSFSHKKWELSQQNQIKNKKSSFSWTFQAKSNSK